MSDNFIEKLPNTTPEFKERLKTALGTLPFWLVLVLEALLGSQNSEMSKIFELMSSKRQAIAKSFGLSTEQLRPVIVFEEDTETRELCRKACFLLDRDNDGNCDGLLEAKICNVRDKFMVSKFRQK